MRYLIVLLSILIAPALTAQSVVATTAWTAAFASAAGSDSVIALAPYEMAHPPEYELRPSDLRTLSDSDLVVYAGYEVMVTRLLDAIDPEATKALRITTGYTREILADSINAIAEALGTESKAEVTLNRLTATLDDWAGEISKSELAGAPAVVHFHQQGLARELGLNVVGTFGPAPLQAAGISGITALNPVLIIDNGHNPIARPIAETTGALVVEWINFPGVDGTRELADVLRYNRDALEETLSGRRDR